MKIQVQFAAYLLQQHRCCWAEAGEGEHPSRGAVAALECASPRSARLKLTRELDYPLGGGLAGDARGIAGSSPLSASEISPSGTLIQNSHGHEPRPKISPPIEGPKALAVETIRLWMPTAMPSIVAG